jgi:hypothetical protein
VAYYPGGGGGGLILYPAKRIEVCFFEYVKRRKLKCIFHDNSFMLICWLSHFERVFSDVNIGMQFFLHEHPCGSHGPSKQTATNSYFLI